MNKEYTKWRQFLAWIGFVMICGFAVGLLSFLLSYTPFGFTISDLSTTFPL